MILGRTDYALLLAPMMVVVLFWRGLRASMTSGIICCVVVAPWFVWEFATTGTLVQSSASAVPVVAHANGPEGLAAVRHASDLFGQTWYSQIPQYYFVPPVLAPVAFSALVALATASCIGWIRGRVRSSFNLLLALSSGVLLISFVHAAVRWYFRDWYLPTIVPVVIIIIAVLYTSMPHQAAARRVFAAAALLLGVAAFTLFALHSVRNPRYPIQGDMLLAAQYLDANTEHDVTVGSLNAGIIGYFSGRQTINLDGVVDGDALQAVKDRQLLDYADNRCVTYFAEFPFYLFWYARFWGGDLWPGLSLVASFSQSTRYQPSAIASDFSIWRYSTSTGRNFCDG